MILSVRETNKSQKVTSNFRFRIKGTVKKDLINELRIYELIKFGNRRETRVMMQHAIEYVVDDEASVQMSIPDYNDDEFLYREFMFKFSEKDIVLFSGKELQGLTS